MKQSSPLASMLALSLAAVLLAAAAEDQAGPAGQGLSAAAHFPSQHAKEIKWLDSLAKGIQEASAARRPICLVLAGQRPAGDC